MFSVSEQDGVKGDCSQKQRQNIALFTSPVKLWEGWAKCLSHGFKFSIGPNLIYFWCAAIAWARRFSTISWPVFQAGNILTPNFQRCRIYLNQIWGGHMPATGASNADFAFLIRHFISKLEWLKGQN